MTVKGKVTSITPKSWTNPQGEVRKFWEFQVEGDDKVYACWQGTFAEKKLGEEVEFEAAQDARNNWKATFKQAGGGGGGGKWGKSPEEIALQKKAFALSYAKDLTNQMIASTVPIFFTGLPDGTKYNDLMENLRKTSVKLTLDTAKDISGFLNT